MCGLGNRIGGGILAQLAPEPQVSRVRVDVRCLVKGNQKRWRVLHCANPPVCNPRAKRDDEKLDDKPHVPEYERALTEPLLHEDPKGDIVGTKSTSVALATGQHGAVQGPDNDDGNEVKQLETEERSNMYSVAVLQSDEAVAACNQAKTADGHRRDLRHSGVTSNDQVTVTRHKEQRGDDRDQQLKQANHTYCNFQRYATQSETDQMFAGFRGHRPGKKGGE